MDPLILPSSESGDRADQIIVSLNAQCDQAEKFLEEHLARLDLIEEALQANASAPSIIPHGSDADGDYQRRYEMALDDLREMKSKNAELQQQFDEARTESKFAPAAASSSGRCLDWEAEKKRILAALEADLDDNDPQQQADRREIEDAINTTEKVIDEKNQKIEELRRRLNERKVEAKSESNLSAVYKTAVDADAAIQQERRRLEELQEEWQEKYRRAEVEMSTERARLARREAELNERAKALSAGENDLQKKEQSDKSDKSDQSAGKRWLTRLGLTEEDWIYRKRR